MRASLLLMIFLLCQCATKHQPIEFAPYFPSGPVDAFSPGLIQEKMALETKTDATPWEKKRLLDIYRLELKYTRPGTPEFERLVATISRVTAEAKSVQDEIARASRDIPVQKEPPTPSLSELTPLTTPGLAAIHRKAYTLWNNDANSEAREQLDSVLSSEDWKNRMSQGERYRILLLDLRVALDMGDVASSEKRFEEMAAVAKCSTESADAAFLVALHYFGAGQKEKALQLIQAQCDPSTHEIARLRKAYWIARFSDPESDAAKDFLGEALKNPLPGYYHLLALGIQGAPLILESSRTRMRRPHFFEQAVDVSHNVHRYWSDAEQSLSSGLRRDASTYLLGAAGFLKDERRAEPLLYTAHMFQAAGNHLEAMRLFSIVFDRAQTGDVPVQGSDFLPEMYPRPFPEKVEWAARMWHVDPDVLYALMRQESAFNPMAVSQVDARGLLQIMPFVARSLASQWNYDRYYTDRSLFWADENLKLAAFHLSQLRAQVPHLALIAGCYNAGYTRVSRWWRRNGHLPMDVFVELVPVSETRNYMKLVLRNFLYYKALNNDGIADTKWLFDPMPKG